MNRAVIVGAVRTASGKGKPGGVLSSVHPVDLLAETLSALLDQTGIPADRVEDVIGGCVSQSGEQSVNVTRHALLGAGFPESVPATTIDRQCGSSQQAAHFAAQAVMAGANDVVIACGVESMSRVPMGSSSQGTDPLGNTTHQRYPDGLVPQGISAELIAAKWGLSRHQLDEFSARSHQLAAAATQRGDFTREIVPVTLPSGDTHVRDETMRPTTTADGLGELPAAFESEAMARRFPEIGWSITPGNSSPLTDGASAMIITSEETARQLGVTPRAAFHSFAVVGDDPIMMLTGVIPATADVLRRAGLSIHDIDAFEVNEAFAPVPLAWAAETGADLDRVNQRGGAIALGHPLGASGTRLMTTLVNTLEDTSGRFGLQTMCEGGGMANATILERC